MGNRPNPSSHRSPSANGHISEAAGEKEVNRKEITPKPHQTSPSSHDHEVARHQT
jgi:hypothetical protein